jgi:hypothetical protein
MDVDLTAIVAADEEARAHLQTAREAAAAQVEQVRRDLEADRAARLDALRAQAAHAVAAIEEQATRMIDERESARVRSIETRRRTAEAALDAAADLYARIVMDGPPQQGRP